MIPFEPKDSALGPKARFAVLIAVTVLAAACVVSRSTRVESRQFAARDSVVVATPLRVHLLDGSTVIFRDGVIVMRDTIRGAGIQQDALLTTTTPRQHVSLDSVIGAETLNTTANTGRTLAYSALATAGTVLGTAVLAVAAFGSCPTFYADSGDTVALEGEGFSYSISSLLEARDIDRLRARPDSTGALRLHVWNEALETHYINHLALVESRHRPEEFIVPDHQGRPVAVTGMIAPTRVSDRWGRDVLPAVAAADDRVFASELAAYAAASPDQLGDWVEIVAPRPETDSVAVVVRLRNSLLNTVMFYDHMLALPGARSLDWLAGDLERIASTVELGRWYAEHFGLRAQVMVDGQWKTVARLADRGPIAWHDAAFVLAVPSALPGDSLRIRLDFLVDEWRIDRIALAPRVRRPVTRTVPLAGVTTAAGAPVPKALEALKGADDQYLQTMPRDRFTISFDVGHAPNESRTFLLVSQGYYTEWVRGEWMRGGGQRERFAPNDSTLLRVVQSWTARKDTMEREFYRSRIPVR